ncbi:MAG: hypothetical protein LBQ18_05965 [Campylobacteraceae bacterium]|jgi:hypothetical protein|nr:hypothetical protein [Campylobacteraceae bacterium]
MGGSKSSSSSNYDYSVTDNSTSQNFEGVGKALTGNAVDASVTTNNYNLASDKAIGDLSTALAQQASATTKAVAEQKSVTNEIVNSIEGTKKTNMLMISIVAATVLLGGGYLIATRKR